MESPPDALPLFARLPRRPRPRWLSYLLWYVGMSLIVSGCQCGVQTGFGLWLLGMVPAVAGYFLLLLLIPVGLVASFFMVPPRRYWWRRLAVTTALGFVNWEGVLKLQELLGDYRTVQAADALMRYHADHGAYPRHFQDLAYR